MSAPSGTASSCASLAVDEAFDYPSRGPFDGKYMQALYEFGVAAGKKGSAFGDGLSGLSMRKSSTQP